MFTRQDRPTDSTRTSLWRSRWAAIGAAIAVSLGAGGMLVAQAAPGPAESTIVNVTPERILDTRDPVNLGLAGPFVSPVAQKLQVTGSVPTATGTKVVVPTGSTGVLLNVTAVGATANGFISIRPGDATGAPTTSSLNVTAGVTVPNAVQVSMPTSGTNAGKIDITWNALGTLGPTTDILIDVVGYTTSTGLQELVADVATKANATALPIARSAREGDVGQLAVNSGTQVLTVTINAPVAGVIQAVGSALIDPPVAAGDYSCALAGLPDFADTDRRLTLAATDDGQCSTNGAAAVAAGTHTVSLSLSAPAAATTAYDDATLDVLFVPGGTLTATSAESGLDSDD